MSDMFGMTTRHSDMLYHKNRLFMFWTEVGDQPEHIKASEIVLSADWNDWKRGETWPVMFPKGHDEGEHLELTKSVRGEAKEPVRQLR